MESSEEKQLFDSNNNNTASKEEESFSYALQLSNLISMPMSMNAAVQLGVFEIIAKAGADAKLSSKQISEQLPTNNPQAPTMLDRVLRVLASYGVVGCSVGDDEQGNPQRLYSLTPVSKHYVPNEEDVSFGPLLCMHLNKVFLDAWINIKDAILEGGIPFNKVYGMDAFEYLGKDQRLNEAFNIGNVNGSNMIMKKILETYKGFEHIKQMVDVGGGLGLTLKLIISKYPSIKGINFDLPHVIRNAPNYPGIQHVGGNMFDGVPKGEIIFMKWMLNGWNDVDCVKILKNCYNAIPKSGKVIAISPMIPFVPEHIPSVQNVFNGDVIVMTLAPGGKERTKQEFTSLGTKAGFSGVTFVCDVSNHWVMEFYK